MPGFADAAVGAAEVGAACNAPIMDLMLCVVSVAGAAFAAAIGE